MKTEDETGENFGAEESTAPLLETDSSRSEVQLGRIRSLKYSQNVFFALNLCWTIILLCVSAVYVLKSLSLGSKSRIETVSSPLQHAIDLETRLHTMKGMIRDDGSIFRQGPSDEVDAAWSSIAFDGYELINVTEADIIASGKDPSTRVRWDPAIDAYPAQVEFAHQIHCLDVVRKEIWGERYFGNLSIVADDDAIARKEYDPYSNEGLYADGERKKLTLKGLRRVHRQHTMHCLHIILQNLMCSVDIGIITHNWVPSNPRIESPLPRPLADFSTKKMCRNFEAATDWVHKNAVKNGDARFEQLTGQRGMRLAQTNDSYWP